MIRAAIVVCLLTCCFSASSQNFVFSRNFPGNRKSIPLEIINNHPNYFYLLRYNKEIHDLAVERRSKPDAEILSFCPLKLDSVNADWFDYENLDHLFFEYNHQVYIFFEKVLNARRELYIKSVDTNGRSSGFLEILYLKKDKQVVDTRFEYKLNSKKNLLIIATQFLINGSVKKTANLYDAERRKMIWSKKLPLENAFTGYSTAFECNEKGDLFFVYIRSVLSSYKRKYSAQMQVEVPVYFYEGFSIISILGDSNAIHEKVLPIKGLSSLKGISLLTLTDELIVTAHYSKQDSEEKENVYFFMQNLSNDLSKVKYSTNTPLKRSLAEKLTYYDGTDYDDPADKEFKIYQSLVIGNDLYFFSERRDETYFKELLTWKADISSGEITLQEIIPRKIFFFKDRTRYKSLGQPAHLECGNILYTFLLESNGNQKAEPADFQFQKFNKQGHFWGGNLTAYVLGPKGDLTKKIFYKNGEFDFVPLKYESDQGEFLFYLSKGRAEKFAILRLKAL